MTDAPNATDMVDLNKDRIVDMLEFAKGSFAALLYHSGQEITKAQCDQIKSHIDTAKMMKERMNSSKKVTFIFHRSRFKRMQPLTLTSGIISLIFIILGVLAIGGIATLTVINGLNDAQSIDVEYLNNVRSILFCVVLLPFMPIGSFVCFLLGFFWKSTFPRKAAE